MLWWCGLHYDVLRILDADIIPINRSFFVGVLGRYVLNLALRLKFLDFELLKLPVHSHVQSFLHIFRK